MSKQKTVYSFEELRETAARYGIEVMPPAAPKPKKRDPGVSALRKSIKQRNRKTTTEGSSAFPRPHHKRKTHYVRDGGREEFVKGEWTERDEGFWNLQARRSGSSRLLEVLIPDGPTVTEDGFVRRGCLCCGRSEIVADKVKFGRHSGGLCLACHIAWSKLTVSQRRGFGNLGVFITRRMQTEGYIDASIELKRTVEVSPDYSRIEPLYVRSWKRYAWCYRIADSAKPAIQEPPTESFGYLSGPVALEQIDGEVSHNE